MIKMISLSWFLTLFLSVLPYTTAAHVIDAFFYDGARVLFVLALTILKNNEEYLLDCSDDGEAMIKLTGYFNQILRDDPEYPPRQEVATASKETGAYKSENQPVTIARLLSDAYERFPHITRTANEKMRLHHRLDVRTSTIENLFPVNQLPFCFVSPQVVQNIEDTQMKNVLRSVRQFTSFGDDELRSLYVVVKNEQLERTMGVAALEAAAAAPDPTRPYCDSYRVDFETFKSVFLHTTPWGAGPETGMALAERSFRLMDTDRDGALNFRELVQVLHYLPYNLFLLHVFMFSSQILDVLCCGDHTRKLRLLYCLHLPGVVLPGELESPDTTVDGEIVGCEATEFFGQTGAEVAAAAATEDKVDASAATAAEVLERLKIEDGKKCLIFCVHRYQLPI